MAVRIHHARTPGLRAGERGVVMQYTLSTGIKQKKIQHMQETYGRKTVKDY